MDTAVFQHGVWVEGPVYGRRRLVDAAAVLRAASELDERYDAANEGYASHFTGASAFRAWFEAHGSDAGFTGALWCPWLTLDFDSKANPAAALATAATLCGALQARAGVDANDMRLFYSGAKGAHLVLPGALFGIEPGVDCPARCKALAERLAAWAQRGEGGAVGPDLALYTRGRIVRLPNSRHPRTGLHRVALPTDVPFLCAEPAHLFERAQALAREPHPFEWLEQPASANATLRGLWDAAAADVAQRTDARAQEGAHFVTRATRAFLADGAPEGERHSRLFDAARNLAECGAPPSLVLDVLREPAMDSGLPEREVRRTVADACAHVARALLKVQA